MLGALLVEAGVDVRGVEGVDRGGEGLDLTLALLERTREGDAENVEDPQRRLAHDDAELPALPAFCASSSIVATTCAPRLTAASEFSSRRGESRRASPTE